MKQLKINLNDNVAVILDENSEIKRGHKIALEDIKAGETVIKYGNPIGTAKTEIKKGEWVHVHNLKTALEGEISYTYEPKMPSENKKPPVLFSGYKRENGKIGVRNEIWIIPTVGCVNNIAQRLATIGKKLLVAKSTVNIDEVVAFPHPYGCSQLGDDQENTRKILANLVNHPNAGGVLLLGLGCENSGVDEIKRYMGDINPDRVKMLVAQDSEDEVEDGKRLIEQLISYCEGFKREDITADKLVVGLKCGGSDGFSGITANPVVGVFSDMLISMGGTTILTEVPEMFGAEQLLMNRAENEAVFEKTVKLINNFKTYFESAGMPIYENPSPGNKDGGISTLEDKSLGCTQKSGTAIVRDVLEYGDTVKINGLNLLSAPGNDLVAATALAAAGAHIVLFTTGRGTPFASPVPTLKISSNSPLAEKKSNWIDFNTGEAVRDESVDIMSLGNQLFELVIETATGKPVKSEIAGYHDMAIFKTGVTL